MSINCVLLKVVWLSFTRIMMHCSFHLISMSQCMNMTRDWWSSKSQRQRLLCGFSTMSHKVYIDWSVTSISDKSDCEHDPRHTEQTFMSEIIIITTQIRYVGVHAIDTAHGYHKWLEHIHGWFLNSIKSCKSHKRNLCVLHDSYIWMADIAMNLM